MDMQSPGFDYVLRSATAVPYKSNVTVLIAHPCPLVSAGLLTTLRQMPECEVSVWDPSQRGRSEKPWLSGVDVVISDSLGEIEHLAGHVHDRYSDGLVKPKILLVTSSDADTDTVSEVEAGVEGRLSLRCGKEELFDAVRCLGDGETQTGRLPPQFVARRKMEADATNLNAKTVIAKEENSFFADRAQTASINGLQRTYDATKLSVSKGKSTLAIGGIAPGALRRVREHVELRLSETLELSELAAVAGLSQCHFSRAFKQSVGETPHRYLMLRRVTAAIELIKHTDQRLTDISLSVGFSDQSHFTRTFVKLTGETPRAYRYRHR
jgi:AraC-like DNA-binding protein/DNA-binding NarL/FixJ family response regulator